MIKSGAGYTIASFCFGFVERRRRVREASDVSFGLIVATPAETVTCMPG